MLFCNKLIIPCWLLSLGSACPLVIFNVQLRVDVKIQWPDGQTETERLMLSSSVWFLVILVLFPAQKRSIEMQVN